MLTAFVTGNLGRDAELKDVNGEPLCKFSVASSRKGKGGKEETIWVSCTIWGKRGSALAQYLVKGQKVAVTGELSTHEGKNGKTYLEIRVAEIDLMGRSGGQGRGSEPEPEPEPSSGGSGDPDEIPF